MKSLYKFIQKDIFPNLEDNHNDVIFEDRLTSKGIVFDSDNKIALVGNAVNSFYLLPGGGVESVESLEDGFIRECLEEIGCKVTILKAVGVIEDYRNRDKKHCINYCYAAKVLGEKGESRLTESEAKNGMHVAWFSFDEVISILEKEVEDLRSGRVTFYNTGFNILRDYNFLIEYRKSL